MIDRMKATAPNSSKPARARGAATSPRGGDASVTGPAANAVASPAGADDEPRSRRVPQNHRTIDRVTRILEEVVYNPGMSFAELVRALDAAKSSVHGFISGLLAKGWLYEENHRFYLGPAVYALALASGHIRAGMVTHADLEQLHKATGVPVFLGVRAGDDLIYIAEAGSDDLSGFEARSNIRRALLATAGGKALLAAQADADRLSFLRRHSTSEAELVETFLAEVEQIRKTGIAVNVRRRGTRYAIAAAVRNQAGRAVASVTLVGPTVDLEPRARRLKQVLQKHVAAWTSRGTVSAREPL